MANIGALAPPPDADVGGEWRAGLVERYAVVRRFLPRLCATIDFGATAEAVPVLDALALASLRPVRPVRNIGALRQAIDRPPINATS